MDRSHSSRIILLALTCQLIIPLFGGCAKPPSGPPRYDLKGEIRIADRPIPSGIMTFTPNSALGNSGPGATAMIEDGIYHTPPGHGTIGGPHFIEIVGHSADSPDDDIPTKDSSPPLRYRIEIDLPKSDGTYDIDIPGS